MTVNKELVNYLKRLPEEIYFHENKEEENFLTSISLITSVVESMESQKTMKSLIFKLRLELIKIQQPLKKDTKFILKILKEDLSKT